LETPSKQVVAIIPCAGLGRRMGGVVPKQFLEIQGKPLVVFTLDKFERCPEIHHVVLVVPPDHIETARAMTERWGMSKVDKVVAGGDERQDSVANGLGELPEECEIVIVHDGVRPFISISKIQEVVAAARKKGAAILAVPVKDTVKRGRDGCVEETLERDSLWAVQTPQGFRTDWIRAAYEKARQDGYSGTDDAALLERCGYRVTIVEGEERNVKITSPEDLAWAEFRIKEEGL